MLGDRKDRSLIAILIITELALYEVFVLVLMEVYKYYINLGIADIYSKEFLRVYKNNFDFLYIGNLIWFIFFIFSIVALLNIYRKIDRVSRSALLFHFLFSIILVVILLFSIILPSRETVDTLSERFLQLNVRGTKILSLSFFVTLNILFTVSLLVLSFSALKKTYIIRSIWLTIISIAAGIAIVFFTVYNYKDDYNSLIEKNMKADAGVVLGAAVWGGNRPSPVLRERINKGFELYKSGMIRYMVVTGGGSPGEMTEAEVSKNELIKKGIDEKSIIIENRSVSTLEQITYVNNSLYKKNKWSDIILITDNFHLQRSKQICDFFNINAYTVSTDTPLSTESTFSFSIKESLAIILFWLFGIG
jgi:vancomycin permeability regulator SanA